MNLLAGLALTAAVLNPPPVYWSEAVCDALGGLMVETIVFKENGAPLEFILNHMETEHISDSASAESKLFILTTIERVFENSEMDFAREIHQECVNHVKARPKGPST